MSDGLTPRHELPKRLEKIIFALATQYGRTAKHSLQRILVNSRYHVQEEWSYDNWNGGTYGHALYFQLPPTLYHEVFENLDEVGDEIRDGVNRISNVQNEFIEKVFLELMDDPTLEDWRERSGVLLSPIPVAAIGSQEQLRRLWHQDYLRLFLSHKASYKQQATALKVAMERFGVSCFVAHEDIEPTKPWQDEIERALFSMEALVALMTEDFADSNWTDQEVGVAFGRQVPIMAVRLGADPHGFIGKFQGVPGINRTSNQLASAVYDLLWKNPSLVPRLTEGLMTSFESSKTYVQANMLIGYLDRLKSAPPVIVERLENVVKMNDQVARAYDVKEKLPQLLNRLRKQQ